MGVVAAFPAAAHLRRAGRSGGGRLMEEATGREPGRRGVGLEFRPSPRERASSMQNLTSLHLLRSFLSSLSSRLWLTGWVIKAYSCMDTLWYTLNAIFFSFSFYEKETSLILKQITSLLQNQTKLLYLH